MNTLDNRILVINPNIKDSDTSTFLSNILEEYNLIYIINYTNIIANISSIRPSLIIFKNFVATNFYKLCSVLNSDPITKNIPVIFIDNLNNSTNPCKIIEAGAIDYIQQPINKQIFKLKVNNYIKLYSSIIKLEENALYAKELNPNTCLPGNTAIKNNIIKSLHCKEDLVVVYTDLDNFKAYNDKYGFDRGDEILKLTGDIILNELKKVDGFTFLGHVGGDDFVFIAPKSFINDVACNIITNFDKDVKNYYNSKDISKGYIISKSRKGKKEKYPIMTISLGGVDLSNHHPHTRYEKIIDICTDVKKHAKTYQKSCFVLDKRKSDALVEDYITAFSSAAI
jgi:diguanylate cyclase (GGDEF)-like protein